MSPAFTLEMDSRMDTGKWLERLKEGRFFDFLDDCGQAGVAALAAATPVRSGYTASSWSYEIKRSRNRVSLVWNNSHVEQGVPIAVVLQYGHGTRTGGYVQGVDYINPALRPIFGSIAKQLESAVRG